MSRAACFRWHKAFKDGRGSCELKGGEGAPTTVLTDITINTAAAIMRKDSRLTVRELAKMLEISVGSAHTILKDHLNMSKCVLAGFPEY